MSSSLQAENLQNFHKITGNPLAITSSRDAGFYTKKTSLLFLCR